MEQEYITIVEFCRRHEAEDAFIDALETNGLLIITRINNERVIHFDELPDLECYVRWHYEMDINLEGIDAMRHLVKKVNDLQQELRELKGRIYIETTS